MGLTTLGFKKVLQKIPKPRGLLSRFSLIFFTPLILVQLVTNFVYIDRHLHSVTKLLAQNIAGASRGMINLHEKKVFTEEELNLISRSHYHLDYKFYNNRSLSTEINKSSWVTGYLIRELDQSLERPYQLFQKGDEIFLLIQLEEGVMQLNFPRKRLFSKTSELVFYWSFGTTLLSILIAGLFLRNQIKPLKDLAKKTKQFGRGEDVTDLSAYGAKEIRNLIESFNTMKNQIRRQVKHRTQVLAGISHDLRTPLTRLKLELSMAPNTEMNVALKKDVEEMEGMITTYLDFAKGERKETFKDVSFKKFLKEIIQSYDSSSLDIHFSPYLEDVRICVREKSMKRVFENIFNNAQRYASSLTISYKAAAKDLLITLDDNGSGIPVAERQDVFQAFYRLDPSRNTQTGGVGLGLSIVYDIIQSHGGHISLGDAPGGGLRINIKLPMEIDTPDS
jgi:two-component system osmolarity sensor histidine kinase EnvZ